MKITANKLTPGTVVGSGETVLKATKSGHFENKTMLVRLQRPNGTTRLAQWGYYSSIFCKSIPTNAQELVATLVGGLMQGYSQNEWQGKF